MRSLVVVAHAEQPVDPWIGRVLEGTYRIDRQVGEGGMGRIYEASHLRLRGRRVAVKVLGEEFAREPEIGDLVMGGGTQAGSLYLDHNQLSGPIPPEIGKLTMGTYKWAGTLRLDLWAANRDQLVRLATILERWDGLARVYQEVAYIAYHFHWPMDSILDLEHPDRARFVAEIGRFNARAAAINRVRNFRRQVLRKYIRCGAHVRFRDLDDDVAMPQENRIPDSRIRERVRLRGRPGQLP